MSISSLAAQRPMSTQTPSFTGSTSAVSPHADAAAALVLRSILPVGAPPAFGAMSFQKNE